MSDPVNDPRPIEEKVLDLQFQAEAQRMDLTDARNRVIELEAIVAKLIHDPRYRNRLAISVEHEEFFGRQIPVKEDGGGGK